MSTKLRSKSLSSRGSQLSDTFFQLKVLNMGTARSNGHWHPNFSETIASHGWKIISPDQLEILQVNIGKLCNQSCGHCHVDAGPDKKRENMSLETLRQCLKIVEKYEIETIDITGGAPELNPNFRWFVESCRNLGKKVMNRCNLTVILSNPKYRDLPQFFSENRVHLISSLPHFSKSRTDRQRGDGVFEDSITALKLLNEAGYGMDGTGLILDLVYNPSGAFLPSGQQSLEAEFKRQLRTKYGIEFNNLYAITNMPISRFLDYLIESGNYDDYMQSLIEAFNPATLNGLMCRNTISVSWDGYLYDCDFNQMLDLKIASPKQHISEFDLDALAGRSIVVNQHCYGCTAGAGSSCGGEIA